MAGLRRRGVIGALAVCGLAGCGFQPLYAPGRSGASGAAEQDLAAISVGIIPNRQGQELRQALQSRFERQGTAVAHRYDLTVAFGIGGEGTAIQQDSSVTHIRLQGSAYWALLGQDPQRSLMTQGVARQLDGYDIINEQYFAADLANDFATKRLAEALADQIVQQLAVYFRKRAAG